MKRSKNGFKSPSHLLKTQHGYYWRLRVPDDIQHIVGKKEMRYALKTHSLKKAKERAAIITGQTQRLFRLIRRDKKAMGYARLTQEKIKELVQEYVKESVDEINDRHLERIPLSQSKHEDMYELSGLVHWDSLEEADRGEIDKVENVVNYILESKGLAVDEKSFKKLSLEILKASAALVGYDHQLLSPGNHPKPETILEPFLTSSNNQTLIMQAPVEPEQTSEPLSAIIESWWKEASHGWTQRTQVEYQRGVDRFNEFLLTVGHGPNSMVHTLGYDVLRAYKERLMGKPKKGKQLSFASVDKYLGIAKAFFNWAVRNNHIQNNPADGLQIGKKATGKRADELQDIFDVDDLKKLFLSEQYLTTGFQTPWQYWLPLLGLFTGARIEELCQLYVDNIKQIDGVWCIDINEGRDDQSVKTHERRIVPIHPFVAKDLRFIAGYIKNLPKDGRLFPWLRRVKHRYSHYASKWFSQYRLSVGIDAQPRRKTFHSFRHTFSTALALADVLPFEIGNIVGHANKSQTEGRYIKRFEPKVVMERAILKLGYVEAVGLKRLVK